MTRQTALLKLHKSLRTRREDLCKKLARELANLRDLKAWNTPGDSGDRAFESSSDEMSSWLAELNAQELSQVEWALARAMQGTYGVCEGGSKNCLKRISAARLGVLPYTTLCINCEREVERCLHGQARRAGNWKEVLDWEAPPEPRRVSLSQLEMNLSGARSNSCF
jgi:DnaK suppressor protein